MLDPSSGGIGIRLKNMRTRLVIARVPPISVRAAAERRRNNRRRNRRSTRVPRPASASARFDAGPANPVMISPLRRFLKYIGL